MNGNFENVSETFEHILHSTPIHRGAHNAAENGLEGMRETLGDYLDLDDDGSITDTLPDLIETGAVFLSSLFGW